MEVRYDKDEDILMIVLSKKKTKLDDTYETEYGLVGVTEKGEPLMIEIFEASKFFAQESKVLPKEIKQKFFAIPA
jgi:uncharacterized protein YuzE